MPGVPSEMKTMLQDSVIPFLTEKYTQQNRLYLQALHFVGLKEHEIDPTLRDLEKQHPHLITGIYPRHSTVTCHLKTICHSQKEANTLFAGAQEALAEKFGNHFFLSESGKIEEAVHDLFIAQNL